MKHNNCKTRSGRRAGSRLASVLTVLALLLCVSTGAWAQTETYTVRMKKGTKDADKWTVTPAEATTTGVMKDTPVSLTYGGRLKVKDVAAKIAPIDLSKLAADYEAKDGDVLTGSTETYNVTIADGATVTLDGVEISGSSYCIKCAGSATIILKDGTTNTLTSTSGKYPALWAGDAGTTLTIQGSTGALDVQSGDYCAGIGGGFLNTDYTCGNIRIEGGVITATGGSYGAGIGSDSGTAHCGNIDITGGTVTATGGANAAGIGTGSGGGFGASCGNITITKGVTKVEATKGSNAQSIGKGYGDKASCGTVTIGGTVYWQDNAAVNGGDTYLAQAKIVYPQTVVNLSTLTADYEAKDGDVLTGTMSTYKVAIAAGATVTLDGVTITGGDYCISCLGDATIVLKDGTTNTLTSTSDQYPALWAGDANTTLTIKGSTGVLNVTSGEYIAGIGGGWSNTNSTCGNITIEGGVITAQGGYRAPGIGSDNSTRCGNITITNGVTKVTAKKGDDSDYSIGAGNGGTCGTIIIGCTLDSDGNPVGGTKYWEDNAAVSTETDNYLKQGMIEYQP